MLRTKGQMNLSNFKKRLAACVAVASFGGGIAIAADHVEAPGATADPAADITDFYAFQQDATQSVVVALNFDGLRMPADAAIYDPDVLYTIHIDSNDDEDSVDAGDHQIEVRFGQDSSGNDGVQLIGIPGNGTIEGAVDSIIPIAGGTVYVGPREDPFFFDLTGHTATLNSGTLSYDDANDDFAGTNVTSIVIEFDGDAGFDGGDTAQLWATTARITTP